MTIIDLFAGPGGWSTGLNLLGRAETLGIEWDKAACDTATAAGHARLQADIAQLDPFTIGGSSVEGLIASPPCQGFSMAGKGRGREDSALIVAATAEMARGVDPRARLATVVKDDRSVLALEPLRWVLDLEPEWTTWEQVPAVLPLWEACADVLRADGYDVWTGLVQAETLGVPQTRKRAILRARRGGLDPLVLTHSRYYSNAPRKLDPGVLKWVSMAEALGWGLVQRPSYSIMAGGKVMPDGTGGHGNSGAEWGGASVRNALRAARDSGNPEVWREHGWGMTDRPSYTVTGGGTEAGGAEPFGHGARDGMERERLAGRWLPRTTDSEDPEVWLATGTRPNAAMRSQSEPSPALAFGHDAASFTWVPEGTNPVDVPTLKRTGDAVRVTVQEAAILQSFPADYPWQGTKTAQYRQVGDAVPPLMAAHVLQSVGAGTLRVADTAA